MHLVIYLTKYSKTFRSYSVSWSLKPNLPSPYNWQILFSVCRLCSPKECLLKMLETEGPTLKLKILLSVFLIPLKYLFKNLCEAGPQWRCSLVISHRKYSKNKSNLPRDKIVSSGMIFLLESVAPLLQI